MANITALATRDDTARTEVAASVRAFIARAGVSKSHVAREIGIAQSTFSRRTTGAEPFDTDELGALATYFGVTLVDLVAGNIDRIEPNAKARPTRVNTPGDESDPRDSEWYLAPVTPIRRPA